MILSIVSIVILIPVISIFIFIFHCRMKFQKIRQHAGERFDQDELTQTKTPKQERFIAFFHPHCSAGGGGERVLWKAIQSLGDLQNAGIPYKLKVAIYTIDPYRESYKKDIFQHISTRFSIKISPSLPITFIHLNDYISLMERKPRMFSMIMESWSTIQLAWNALHIFTPHIFMDTTGHAFTFFVARILANCKVGAYVHYPTISTDMLSLVWDRRPTYNNNSQITSNSIMTYVKLVYYTLFAFCYGFVGSLSNLVMVNSSWTYSHIRSLWRFSNDVHIVFPPCDTQSLEDMPLSLPNNSNSRENIILSIGQFRPEKDHELQIRAFAKLMQRIQDNKDDSLLSNDIKLVLIGSCRGKADEERVANLKTLAQKCNVSKHVDFVINQPFPVLKEWLGKSSIGIHTMWNEHFGIGVVEMMAAGLITIAHNSGGPKSDIIVPLEGNRTGYLASTDTEYANAMYTILFCNTSEENMYIRTFARKASKSFSDEIFEASFKSSLFASNILN